MQFRTFAAGDDVAQVSIYNDAAAALPKFKTATLDEVRRRTRPPEFDPTTRWFAIENNRPVGYVSYHATGRVSFPWTRKGHDGLALPLFQHMLEVMKQRGITRIFAAYRGDWPSQREFFLGQGFQATREVINYVIDINEMPTPAARVGNTITGVTAEDMPDILKLGPNLFRVNTPAELEKHLLKSAFFGPESVFALRSRTDGQPLAVGLIVDRPAYANPKQVDAAMPCFRAGAFGSEGMQVKRLNGMFSFVASADRDVSPLSLDLLSHAAFKVQDSELETFCAQVTSDNAHLVRFYKQYFRRQGTFPLYERDL